MRSLRTLFLAHYNHNSLLGLGCTSVEAQGGIQKKDGTEQNRDSVWNEEGAMGMDVEQATHSVYDNQSPARLSTP